jgi:hypothetical protein
MTSTAELPVWAVVLIGVGTPLLAFLGGVLGQRVARRGDVELERRSRREEVMRNLRWAAELAVSDDPRAAALGVSELRALALTDLLGDSEKVFVQAALDAVVEAPQEAVEARAAPEAWTGPARGVAGSGGAARSAADSEAVLDVPSRQREEDGHG